MVLTTLEFTGFMRFHMRGLHLWGVLSSDVSCPSCPIAHIVPALLTPPALAADATQAENDAAKGADDAAIVAYDQKVKEYSAVL